MASIANAEITEIRQASTGLAALAMKPLLAGAVIIAVAAAAAFGMGMGARFWHAYLLGLMYCTTLGVGGLFFVLVHHLTGGRWGTTVRRLAELTSNTLWFAAILFIPVLWTTLSGDSELLYPWADRDLVMGDHILAGKADYLSPKWFAIRSAIYFAIWITMAKVMLGMSVKQDTTTPLALAKRMQTFSAPMMVVFAFTLNFASFDWFMTLEPHWFSTMMGVYIFAGAFTSFMALALVISINLQKRNILSQSITTEHIHDMAKLMFAFMVFWAYIAFSQFLLIWYAAIPEETFWYDVRWGNGWLQWGALLLFGHLFIPFIGMMSKHIRRNKKIIGCWAIWMLIMHWVDLVYLIQPQTNNVLPYPWLEALVTIGMMFLFAGIWMRGAAGKNLLPIQDPRLPLALSYHNH